ncbi:hypothetical protein INS49_015659 [Diaporthe citri]|uniref:uncharacterized protein n=1 Tax=Diaporthe citri TaxID=83186 RepID=UPI001C82594E|nr:uncharacterized protein INS49_015659 [Diaporthe citri]KAG6356272.1 hypothetical protein INS49_015659 [Diaporthe citri]
MLHATACLITSGERPDQEYGLQILQWLLDRGFQVKADALLAAVHDHDVPTLECLASVCHDFEKEGGEALAQVALRSDFDAIKLVLDIAVDYNPTTVQENNNMLAAATEMLDADADPNGRSFDTDPFYTFHHRQGQTPLQAAAGNGDYTVVCMLMERGADVNEPALGGYDTTALQAICVWDPVRREERLRKDKIIKLFLDKGGDVNATNSTGHTALIYAAQLGDLSTTFTLLKHGAKLDAISTSYYHSIDEHRQTALDVAACYGRLDMVEFLLNANALSWSAYSDGKGYDGAIEWARKRGHFVVSELIRKHSADRKRWDVRHGQAIDERISPEHIPQTLSLPARSETASWPQNERRLTPSENLQGVAVLDRTNSVSYAHDEDMIASSTAASKVKGESRSGSDATGVSWTRVIEEIEDEELPAVTGREKPRVEESDGTANQAFSTGNASSRPGEWLHQQRDQNWVEDEQQSVDPLVPSSSSTDVFMGFSEFPSP